MFKEKYGINPNHLALWSSIYLLTVIPAYEILFTRVPYMFFMVILVENIVSFYIFQDELMEDLLQSIKGKAITFFTISLVVALLSFLSLLFYNLKLFIIICIIEVVGFTIIQNLFKLNKMKR